MNYVIKGSTNTYLTTGAYRDGIVNNYHKHETQHFETEEQADAYLVKLQAIQTDTFRVILNLEPIVYIAKYGYFVEHSLEGQLADTKNAFFVSNFIFTDDPEKAKVFNNEQECDQMRRCIEFILGQIK